MSVAKFSTGLFFFAVGYTFIPFPLPLIFHFVRRLGSFNDIKFYAEKCMSKFQKVKKHPGSGCSEKTTTSTTNPISAVSNYCMICPIPEIAKIQVDPNPQNIYVMVFMSENPIYQKYKTTHSFEILKPNVQETFQFHSYFFHYQSPKTIQPFFHFDPLLEAEIDSNQREYVIVGWIVRCGTIIGILYVQMYNQACHNFNVLIIEDCPFICFLGTLTNTFFGMFLNNIRLLQSDQ
jgi:hypothetical protein